MKKRVQLDFDPAEVAELDRITTLVKSASRAETVRRALELLDKIKTAQAEGRSIMIVRADGTQIELWVL